MLSTFAEATIEASERDPGVDRFARTPEEAGELGVGEFFQEGISALLSLESFEPFEFELS